VLIEIDANFDFGMEATGSQLQPRALERTQVSRGAGRLSKESLPGPVTVPNPEVR
jgi:hypothetical protein